MAAKLMTPLAAYHPWQVAGKPADFEQGTKIVLLYREAGVTWWLEGIWTERGSLEDMKERIRQGPPI